MKKIFLHTCFFAVLAFSACDIVKEPYEPKPEEPVIETPVDTSEVFIQVLDSVEMAHGVPAPLKTVLLEDYTGHTCGNCPRAAEIATTLDNQYKERLVVMAVHIGYFAKTKSDGTGKYTYDFTTSAGNEFDQFYSIDQLGLPQGMVNRVKPNNASSPILSRGTWASVITSELAKAPVFNLNLTNVYKSGERKVDLKVRTEALTNLSGTYKVGIYITEDSIFNWQKDYQKNPADIENYLHRHALRKAINGTWGQEIMADPKSGEIKSNYYQFTLNPEWVDKNCSVVAFIYNESSKEILQVAEQHIAIH